MIEGINHIAIAVTDITQSIEMFKLLFNLDVSHREYIESYGVDTATFKIGGTEIELVEGKTDDSAIKKYVNQNGPGIHHIAFDVANIDETVRKLKASSVKLIDGTPRCGKEGSRVSFIHPSATQGILFELVQRAISKEP